ncbi:MAG: metallophosphoesterase [Planctomycetaceae bacterium]|jgi:DNA repair exonuclease SbcCD nuclease subunit|nr:metallophosphoesterase [Planctomycetaceae bacterium]
MIHTIAILISDIHLSHVPPVARNNEPDWYAAMERQLIWLKQLQKEHNNPPIIAAGDIFHRWNSSPELINFAIRYLPSLYAVPGQHDLPYHSLQEIKKSAYWTLVESGTIIDLPLNKSYYIEIPSCALALHGFPFGVPLQPNTDGLPYIHIAVVHDYCWQSGYSYPNAPTEKTADEHIKSGSYYHVIHFGDNHKGFLKRHKHQWIFNGGTFYRRSIDEIDYRPMVGLVLIDDKADSEVIVKPVPIPITEDVFTVKVQSPQQKENIEIGEFVDYLSNLSINALDIEEVIRQYTVVHSVPDAVTTEIFKLLEQTRHG